MRSTFKLLYFVKRNAVKKNGNAPIIARITIDQVVAQFNTKLEINPAHWSVKLGKASGRTAEADISILCWKASTARYPNKTKWLIYNIEAI